MPWQSSRQKRETRQAAIRRWTTALIIVSVLLIQSAVK
jgi:hypothetical protein